MQAGVRDLRHAMEQKSKERQAWNLRRPPPKHRWHSPNALESPENLGPPEPGGTGFGYYFQDAALLWSNSTFIDYYIITPSQLGGTSTNWLYLTTTCRAQLGTEALVGYYQQDEAQLMVFDWARTASQPWQIGINLPTDHPQYLTVRLDEFGNPRPMCRVRNGTILLNAAEGAYLWRNEVLLFNFEQGDWDLIYTYEYVTDRPERNRFQPGANGYWGPIVETFGSYDLIQAIGFEQVRLFQDAKTNVFWLSAANSFLQREPVFQPITVAPNRSFVTYAGSRNPDSFPFRISGIARDEHNGLVTLEVGSLAARDFRIYNGISLGGQWTWLPVGLPVAGTGQTISLPAPAPLRMGVYKVGADYNAGSLCLIVNQPNASFQLSPAAGVVLPHWTSQPLSNRWDKTIVALPPGKYTIGFDSLPGLTAPPPQDLIVTNHGMTTVRAFYGTVAE